MFTRGLSAVDRVQSRLCLSYYKVISEAALGFHFKKRGMELKRICFGRSSWKSSYTTLACVRPRASDLTGGNLWPVLWSSIHRSHRGFTAGLRRPGAPEPASVDAWCGKGHAAARRQTRSTKLPELLVAPRFGSTSPHTMTLDPSSLEPVLSRNISSSEH